MSAASRAGDHVDRGVDPLAALAEIINQAGISGGNTHAVARAVRDAGWTSNVPSSFEESIRRGASNAYAAARVRRATSMIAAAIEAMPCADEGPYCRDAAAVARQVGERVAQLTEGADRG